MRRLLAVVVAVWVGVPQPVAAEPIATGDGCVKEAFARADAGKPEEGLPWLVEALRLDAGNPGRLALHRQRLAWLLQGAADRARRPVEPAEPRPRWNGHGFTLSVHFHTTTLQGSYDIEHAAVSPDGRWVACVQKELSERVGGPGDSGLLWDLQQPEVPPRLIETKLFGSNLEYTCQPDQVLFSPDSRRVALAFHSISAKGYVQVWDCATARPIGPPLHMPYYSRALAFSPDGNHIAAGWGETCGGVALGYPAKDNYGARVWETTTGKPLAPPIELPSAATLVRFSPDGRRLLVGTLDGLVLVWDIPTNKPAGPVLRLGSETNDAAFLPDGRRVAVAARAVLPEAGEVNLWDLRTGRRLDPRLSSGRAVGRLWLGADGRRLFARLDKGSDRLLAWDLNTGEPIANESARRIDSYCVLAPDAKRVFVLHGDGKTGHLRDTSTGERLSLALVAPQRTIGPEQETTHFSRDGRRLIAWSEHELVIHTVPVLAWPDVDTADLAALVAGQAVREGRLVALEPIERRAVGERLAKRYPAAFAAVKSAPAEPRAAYRRVELSARIDAAVVASREDKGRADARKALTEIVRQQPDATDAWLTLAYACKLDEERLEARRAYDAVLANQPHHRDALLGRGRLFVDDPKCASPAPRAVFADRARTDLWAALDLQPRDWKPQFLLAAIEMYEGQWETALDLFARAEAAAERLGENQGVSIVETDYPYIFRNRGTCFAELGRWKEAAGAYRRAVELHDAKVGFRSELVRIYAELREFDSARALCEPLVPALADGTEASRVDAIAWLCCARPGLLKDYGPAIRAIERIVETRPNVALYRETLAWLHLRAGQPVEAARHYETFAKLRPEGGVHFWTGMALALQRGGKADAAKEFRAKALIELKRRDDAAATTSCSWTHRLDDRHYRDELAKAFPVKTDKP
jgi:WD40 repeat protein/tetratricopeptide (TPR) repeat protein